MAFIATEAEGPQRTQQQDGQIRPDGDAETWPRPSPRPSDSMSMSVVGCYSAIVTTINDDGAVMLGAARAVVYGSEFEDKG